MKLQRVTGFWVMIVLAALEVPSARAGGSAQRISGLHEGNCYNPAVSADGKKVAYEVNFFDRRVVELYIFDLELQKDQQIVPSKGGSAILKSFNVESAGTQVSYELAWSPKRPDLYVFASSGSDENFDIYWSRGGTLASAAAADGMATWSHDGQLIAFTSARSGEGDLYLLDINATEKDPLQITKNTDSTEWYPTFNPKDRRLLFVRHFSKGGDNLFLIKDVANAAKTTVQLTEGNSLQTKPSWSPDGKLIAFYSNRAVKERYDLYVMEPQPKAAPKLVMEGIVPNDRLGPTWTPDSKGLLAVKDDPERFNPIRLISVIDPAKQRVIATGTQNNGDTHLMTKSDGQMILTFTAQGRIGDNSKCFKRVYLYSLEAQELVFPEATLNSPAPSGG